MLRQYQLDASAAVAHAWVERRSALLALPCGTGKTITFCHIGQQREGRILVLAHRGELLDQCADTLRHQFGENAQYEMAGRRADKGWERPKWTLATIQSLYRRKEQWQPDTFSTVIFDEVHHATAKTWHALYSYFSAAKVLGVSATPERDGLEMLFPVCDYRMSLFDAICAGWLTDIQAIQIDAKLDLSSVKTTAGDFNKGELAGVMERNEAVYIVAGETLKHAGWRQTIVYAVSVAQSKQICDQINYLRPNSALFLSGETPSYERRSGIADFRRGAYQFLVNCELATEGNDFPNVSCIAIARPTKSRILHTQMIGRGLRPIVPVQDGIDRCAAIAASDKPFCSVLDFVGNCGRHRLVTVMSHFQQKERHKGIVADWLRTGKQFLVTRVEDEAEKVIDTLPAVNVKIISRSKIIDPLGILTSALANSTNKKAHPAALGLIRKHYWFKNAEIESLNTHEASALRAELLRRWKNGLCSVKQARVLVRYGYDPDLNRAQASEIITKLSLNGWKALT